jgi:hypothetical protein
MSFQNIPEIPGVDPAAVRSMTRLCSGTEDGSVMVHKPYIFYIGDDPYFFVSDGSTMILLLLENGVPDKMEVEWNETVQEKAGNVLEKFGTDYVSYYEDVEIGDILAWCASGTEKCPKCHGTKTCLYPRHGTTAATREDPKAVTAHEGVFYGIFVDRRRVGVTLQILGIDEGTCDVSVYRAPTPPEGQAKDIDMVILSGENWRIITAPLKEEEEESIGEEVPRFPAS